MHRIDDAIVHNGKLTLVDLPFAEGQHVQVVVTEQSTLEISKRLTIDEARAIVRGSTDQIVDPGEPMIPEDAWDALK